MPNASTIYLELDKTGQSIANRVFSEQHATGQTFNRLIIPKYGAFFADSLALYKVNTVTGVFTPLVRGVDYFAIELLHNTTVMLGKEVCLAILITEASIATNFIINYQALGGSDQINVENLYGLIDQLNSTTATIAWDSIPNKPKQFVPADHLHDSADLYGLEYITGAVDRVRDAVLIGDRQNHVALISRLDNKISQLIEPATGNIQTNVDLTMTLVKSTNDTLKIIYDSILSLRPALTQLKEDLENLNKVALDHRASNYNELVSNTLSLLCSKEYQTQGTLLDVPSLINNGLVVYLQSDLYNPTTGVWTDKVNGSYNSIVSTRPMLGPSHIDPNIDAVKFTNGSFLTRATGPAVELGSTTTLITVTAPLINTSYVKMNLINDSTSKITIDSSLKSAFKYSNTDETLVSYDGKMDKNIAGKYVVNIATISDRLEDCNVFSSSPFKRTLTSSGVMQNTLAPQNIGIEVSKIGSSSGVQNAELLLLLAYNRLLSRAEIHAILTYVKMKYNTEVQFIENGDFTQWDEGFGSDLSNTIDFVNRNCIGVTRHPVGLLDTANTYIHLGSTTVSDIKIDNNPYLLVLSNDQSLAFWRQTVNLDTYCRYEFRLSIVHGQINPPSIVLKINDVVVGGAIPLSGSDSILRNYVISFVPNAIINKIELFNLNENTVGNSFAVGAMSLVRKIYLD